MSVTLSQCDGVFAQLSLWLLVRHLFGLRLIDSKESQTIFSTFRGCFGATRHSCNNKHSHRAAPWTFLLCKFSSFYRKHFAHQTLLTPIRINWLDDEFNNEKFQPRSHSQTQQWSNERYKMKIAYPQFIECFNINFQHFFLFHWWYEMKSNTHAWILSGLVV